MQAEGFVTVEQVERKFSWSTGRAIDVLETLLKVNPAPAFPLFKQPLCFISVPKEKKTGFL
jgi:hypothetical protein